MSYRTWLQGLQRQSSLSSRLGTVVLYHSKAKETHFFEVHAELKVFAPHRVQGVAVDGFGTEVAAVDLHAQNIHFNAGAAGAVTRTNILTRDNLEGRTVRKTVTLTGR